jgi:hypothetical protein
VRKQGKQMRALDRFRDAMAAASAPLEPDDVARLLEKAVIEACNDAGLDETDIRCGSRVVMMFLSPRHPWETVVMGPNSYQFYPGFLRDDGETVVWANVWVGENYTLEKYLAALEREIERAVLDEDIP